MVSLATLLRTPALLVAAAQFALALGCARLAYGLLLPGMADGLATSAAGLGAVGTLNFAGYLLGTLLIPWLQRLLRGRVIVIGSGVVLAISLLLTAITADLISLAVLRFVSGAVSAPLMIMTQTFAIEAVPAGARGRVMGIVWGGGALGILVSGLAAPWALSSDGWRLVWAVAGGSGLLITLGWHLLVRGDLSRRTIPAAAQPAAALWNARLRWLALAYALFGAGYISYFIYAVATFVEYGLPATAIGYAWATLGAVGLLSGPFWGWVIDHRPTARVLAAVLALGALGAATIIVPQPLVLVGGAALVGWCAFIAPPLIVATLVRRQVDAASYPALFSGCTIAFSLGQVAAPLLGAALGAAFGFGIAALLGALALVLGALAATRAGEAKPAARIAGSV